MNLISQTSSCIRSIGISTLYVALKFKAFSFYYANIHSREFYMTTEIHKNLHSKTVFRNLLKIFKTIFLPCVLFFKDMMTTLKLN